MHPMTGPITLLGPVDRVPQRQPARQHYTCTNNCTIPNTNREGGGKPLLSVTPSLRINMLVHVTIGLVHLFLELVTEVFTFYSYPNHIPVQSRTRVQR